MADSISPSNRISAVPPPVSPQSPGSQGDNDGGFAATLAEASSVHNLKFSAHAQKRLASRDIQLDYASIGRLARAVEKAHAKGARDSLMLLNDLGLIVNVPSRTVVTAMDGQRMTDGVFTNIDSTVIIRD